MTQLLWQGVANGSLYALIGLGYALIFGVLQLVFFAQGELSMLAAFAALGTLTFASRWLPNVSRLITIPLALLAAVFVSIAAGLASERLALRPLRSAPRVKALVTSLGVSIVLQNLVMLTVGPEAIPFATQFPIPIWRFGGVTVSGVEVAIVSVLFLCSGGLAAFLRYHRFGLAMRAVAQSPRGARLMGINPDRAVMLAFALGSSIAAVAGVFLALYHGVVKFNMGFVPGIKGFTIAILGGSGRVSGAVVAGLLVGVLEALFAGYISSDYRDMSILAILVLTLILRPQGLFGEGG